MISLTQKDITFAQKYSVNPLGMRGILEVYESLSRFIGLGIRELEYVVTEEAYHHNYTKAPKYTYSELPFDLSRMLRGIMDRYGSVESYLREPNSEHNFIQVFIKNRYQPKDFLFEGVLTPRHMKRGEFTDNTFTVEVTEYGGAA